MTTPPQHPGNWSDPEHADERIARAYDTVADDYAAASRDELHGKPLDRALLAAVVEMSLGGRVADLGCGPGHVAGYLASLGADVIGIDLSASMIRIARTEHPDVEFHVDSMTHLNLPDDLLSGAVLLYSIIHLLPSDRMLAFEELHRVLRPGGIALISFHIRSEENRAGSVNRMTSWFGHTVDLEGYYLDPEPVLDELVSVGLDIASITTRMPHADQEFPSERAYVLVQKPESEDPEDQSDAELSDGPEQP